MGVVKLARVEYTDINDEKAYIKQMIEYEQSLQIIMTQMYRLIARFEPDGMNSEGCVEAKIMRSVYCAMSKVRYNIKNNSKIIED